MRTETDWIAWMIALLMAVVPGTATEFAQKPTVTGKGGDSTITFEVKAFCGVTVAIENEAGHVVRHLAGGMLGPNAPEPFRPNARKQVLTWDRTDDRGKPVPAGQYTVRVGLGTRAAFERVIGQRPEALGNIHAMAVGRRGELFVYCGQGICVLDREGKYVRQIAPAPESLAPSKLKGLEPLELPDGSVCLRRPYPFPAWDRGFSGTGSMAVTPDGHLLLAGPPRYPRTLIRLGTDGSVPEGAFDTKLTRFQGIGFLYFAVTPDGKYLYFAGHESGYLGHDYNWPVYRHAVYRLKLESVGPAEIFVGDDENASLANAGFTVNQPRGVACDAAGNCAYVGDGRSQRIVKVRLDCVAEETARVE